MTHAAFISLYRQPRNGAQHLVRHWLGGLLYTDGVQGLADQGCHWLLDIVATECVAAMRGIREACLVQVCVESDCGPAHLSLQQCGGGPVLWSREMSFADLPQGTWKFELGYDGKRHVLSLLSEH